MEPEATISLISVNQRHDLERLLPSLSDAAKFVRAEVILVDCHSNDVFMGQRKAKKWIL